VGGEKKKKKKREKPSVNAPRYIPEVKSRMFCSTNSWITFRFRGTDILPPSFFLRLPFPLTLPHGVQGK